MTHLAARAAPAGALLENDPTRGLWHADVPGLLAATIRATQGGQPDILYARSPLLEALRIPGGRIEAAGGEFDLFEPAADRR